MTDKTWLIDTLVQVNVNVLLCLIVNWNKSREKPGLFLYTFESCM